MRMPSSSGKTWNSVAFRARHSAWQCVCMVTVRERVSAQTTSIQVLLTAGPTTGE